MQQGKITEAKNKNDPHTIYRVGYFANYLTGWNNGDKRKTPRLFKVEGLWWVCGLIGVSLYPTTLSVFR